MANHPVLPTVGAVYKRFEGGTYAVVLGAEGATPESPARVTVTTLYTKPMASEPDITRRVLEAFLLDYTPLVTRNMVG